MNSSNWLSIISVHPRPSVYVSDKPKQYLVSSGSMDINNYIPMKEHGRCAANIH